MITANIQRKNTFLTGLFLIAIGLVLSAGLNATASYDVTTIAGVAGSSAHTDGVGTSARFIGPGMLSIDNAGNLLVPDSDKNVRQISTTDGVYTVSTLFQASYTMQAVCQYITTTGIASILSTDGSYHLYQWILSSGTYSPNESLNTKITSPMYAGWGLVADSSKNIYMTDSTKHVIFKIQPSGTYSVFAGTYGTSGATDGTQTGAVSNSTSGSGSKFNGITGVTIDGSGNLYASDTGNNTIRKITSAGVVTTIAGTAGSSGSTDAEGPAARFNSPWDIDIDKAGNLYVADKGNNIIRKLTLSGATYTVSTIAGKARGHLDGTGTVARFIGPGMLSIDNAGNLLVPDSDQNVRQVSTTDGVYTVSTLFQGTSTIEAVCQYITSTGTSTILSTDSFANLYQWVLSGGTYVSNTSLNAVTTPAFAGWGLVADSSKNIYMTDSTKHVIFKIQPSGTYSVFAGTYGTSGATDGTQTGAGSNSTSGSGSTFNGITGITIDSSGNLYVSDTGNNLIRKITPAGVVTTIAGSTRRSVDGVGTSAQFINPGMLSINLSTGDLLVPGSDNNVRKVTTAGGVYTVSTLFNYNVGSTPVQAVCAYITSAGASILTTDNYSHLYQWTLSGGRYVSSSSLDAVSTPAGDGYGLVVDSSNNIFMTDSQTHRIFKILQNGSYSIFAGSSSSGTTDGTGTAARFKGITGITIDSSNNLYASDTGNNTIRKITPAGVVTTIAGTAGSSGSTDAAGSSARFNSPWDIDIDGSGNLYIADRGNNLIRKLTLSGATYTASTIAGTAGLSGSTDGTGAAARFNAPTGIAVDSSGNIFVSDTNNDTIRKITSGGVVTTVAGLAGVTSAAGSTDAIGTAAKFNSPWDIDIDSSGNLYVADKGNNLIRKLTNSSGTYTVSTIAGTAGSAGSTDGTGAAARFNAPTGLAFNPASGMIFVSDTNNDTIRQINPATNQVITVAGATIVSVGSTDGTGAAARFNAPTGLAVDASGNVFVTDTGNNTIRKLLSKLTVSGGGTLSATATGKAYIQGGGTAVLPASNSISAVEVNNGTLQVSSSTPITFNASGGSAIVEILAAINTGAFTFNTPGAVKIGTGIAAILDAPSGNGTMSKTGAGRLRAIANLSSSTTPVAVSEGILEVSGTGRLPNAATSVASGATLQLGTSGGTVASGAVANASVASGGIMSILAGANDAVTSADISSGGIVSVAAGVTAPSGMFTSATFRSGGILQVGDGATLGQSFTSVP